MTVIFAVTVVLVPFALINLREGLHRARQRAGRAGRSLSRSRWRASPCSLVPRWCPTCSPTLRIRFGVAWKVTLTAELFGGNAGLGYLINVARQEFETETIFADHPVHPVVRRLRRTLFFRPLQRHLDRRYRMARVESHSAGAAG